MRGIRINSVALAIAAVGLGLIAAAPTASARTCDTNGETGDIDTPVAEVNTGKTEWQWLYLGVCTPADHEVDVYFIDDTGDGNEPDTTPDIVVEPYVCGAVATALTPPHQCVGTAAGAHVGTVALDFSEPGVPDTYTDVKPCVWVKGQESQCAPASVPTSTGSASGSACQAHGDFRLTGGAYLDGRASTSGEVFGGYDLICAGTTLAITSQVGGSYTEGAGPEYRLWGYFHPSNLLAISCYYELRGTRTGTALLLSGPSHCSDGTQGTATLSATISPSDLRTNDTYFTRATVEGTFTISGTE